MTSPLTDQQLDEYEALIQRATPLGAATASPGMAATLLAEIRRQRDEAAEHQAEKAKLIRWHGEDEATFAEMRGTIGRLRTEKRELGELAARRESELIALRARLEKIRHLHKDSPMGPCPVCIDADAAAAGGDGLVPYPCPTGRLAGAQDCDPPHVRAARYTAAGNEMAASLVRDGFGDTEIAEILARPAVPAVSAAGGTGSGT